MKLKTIIILFFLGLNCNAQFFQSTNEEITNVEDNLYNSETVLTDPDQGTDGPPNSGEDPVPINQFDLLLISLAILFIVYYNRISLVDFYKYRN